MSIKGFVINGTTQKYDYEALDNKPVIPSGGGVSDDLKAALLQLAQKVAYVDANGENYYADLYDALYPQITTYSITNNLTAVTNSNSASVIAEGGSYTAALSWASNYELTSIIVTMGGTDVTGISYSSGTISIPNVTGNIIITAVATQRQATLSSISAVFTQGQNVIYDTDTLDTLKQYLTVTATWSDSSTSTVAASDYTLSGTLATGTSTITVSYGGKTTTFTVTVTHLQDTTVELDRTGVVLAHYASAPVYRDFETEYGGVTIAYTLNSPTTTLFPAGIIPTTGNTMYSAPASLYILDSNDTVINYVGMAQKSSPQFYRWAQDANGTMTEYSQTWTVSEYSKIQFSVDTRYVDDAYMYDKTTGQVWFAGKNTPYYGMSNISEAS